MAYNQLNLIYEKREHNTTMTLHSFIFKVQNKFWAELVHYTKKTPFYLYIYRSYWHYLFSAKKEYNPTPGMYFAARPNPGAGIGHQMANWIAGYWWAKQLGLKFAHMSFSNQKWDNFLGFGEDEINIKQLQKQGYKLRRLPHFSENDKASIDFVKRIMASYQGRKIIFWPPQDHGYKDQYGVMEDIQQKFYKAQARKNDKCIYSKDNFNIAIHVRRGDIMADSTNPNLTMRYLSNDYFEKVLKQVIDNLQTSQPVHIYFFSQGTSNDYLEFTHYKNLHWCLDMPAQDSFLHMVYADLLITSKSSFSYKPALLNKNIKVCPRNFWHGYPNKTDWILCENDGSFNTVQLKNLIHE